MSDGARVGVLLCGYGEVEDYDEFADYNERSIRLLVSKSIKFPDFSIPWLARLLEKKNRKEWAASNHYHSPHNEIFEQQRAGIEAALQRRYGDRVAVFKAFNFCPPDLPEQVLPRMRATGYDHLVVYPLLVVDSVFTSGLVLEQVNDALGGDGSWVQGLRYLPSFYERPDYHRRLAAHIGAQLAPLRSRFAASQIGLVLLNHGCPLESKGHEVGIRESEALYHSVRELLVNRYPLISIGWMNHPTPGKWTTPDMDQATENLLTLGARVIAYAPIGFVTENHETQLDVGYTIDKLAGRAEHLHLPSLNADPEFLDLAAGWISPLVDDLLVDGHREGAG